MASRDLDQACQKGRVEAEGVLSEVCLVPTMLFLEWEASLISLKEGVGRVCSAWCPVQRQISKEKVSHGLYEILPGYRPHSCPMAMAA